MNNSGDLGRLGISNALAVNLSVSVLLISITVKIFLKEYDNGENQEFY